MCRTDRLVGVWSGPYFVRGVLSITVHDQVLHPALRHALQKQCNTYFSQGDGYSVRTQGEYARIAGWSSCTCEKAWQSGQ